MMSLEVKALGSPQGLMVKGTHIPVPREVSKGDVVYPQRSGGWEGHGWSEWSDPPI